VTWWVGRFLGRWSHFQRSSVRIGNGALCNRLNSRASQTLGGGTQYLNWWAGHPPCTSTSPPDRTRSSTNSINSLPRSVVVADEVWPWDSLHGS
jgi:hypothetical protein